MATPPNVTFRMPPDLAEKLEAFTAANPAWSKSEAVLVGLHLFLETADDKKDAALIAFRSRLKPSANPPKKKG